jgi:MFS family permease
MVTAPLRFLIVWAGQLVSGLGTGMTGFALGVHVFHRTGSAADFGLVLAALFVPSIVLRPLGGVLADRFERRIIIVLGDLGSAAGVLFLLLSLTAGELTLFRVYVGVAMSSASSALQGPAYKASVSDLLGARHYARAGGLMQLASAAQHLLSPMAAGALLATAGLPAVLFIDLSSFAVAVAAVLVIRGRTGGETARPHTALRAELREAIQALTAHRSVLDTVLAVSVITLFVGLLQTLFGPMMLAFTDARTLGLVQSISASGMLASSLLVGAFGIPWAPRRTLVLGLLAAGCFLSLMGMRANVLWITATFFLFFACLPLINTAAEVLIRTGLPNELQGRVWGIVGLLSQLGYVTAYVFGGVVADTVFAPLLLPNGAMADSVGRIVGIGSGRGIAFMLTLAGIGLTLTAALSAVGRRRVTLSGVTQRAYQ